MFTTIENAFNIKLLLCSVLSLGLFLHTFGCLLSSLLTMHLNSFRCQSASVFYCAFDSVFGYVVVLFWFPVVLSVFCSLFVCCFFFVPLCHFSTSVCFCYSSFSFLYHGEYLLACVLVFIINNYFDSSFVISYTYSATIRFITCVSVTTSVRMFF